MRRTDVEKWCRLTAVLVLAIAACTPNSPPPSDDTPPDNTPPAETPPPAEQAAKVLPSLKSARSLSLHYVEVVFNEAAGAESGDVSRYQIVGPDDRFLDVTAVRRLADTTRVVVTTAAQLQVQYTIRVAGSGNASPQGSASFTGTNGSELSIVSSLALDNTSVLVTFSEAMDDNALLADAYLIDSPGLEVVTANKASSTSVRLTTVPQQSVEYRIRGINISAGNGAKLIDPDNSATFAGFPPVDTGSPSLLTAAVVSDTQVLLSFSEPMADGMDDPLNFTISPSLLVSAAQLSTYNTQILLTTLPMQAGIDYTVATSATLQDKAGNAIDSAKKSAKFKFTGQTQLNGAQSLPRVVGAIAMSNTKVRVAFSKVMGTGLEDKENYAITGVDTAFLLVLGATAGADRTYVDLETSSQAPGDYVVHVVNVKDASGNPLMAPSGLLAPPEGVDPASAKFRAVAPVIDVAQSIDDHTDTDGDHFADWFETVGWILTVEFANGTTTSSHVTSDIYSPDTDGDGLDDSVENQWSFDPRTDDSDADHLTDGDEFNVYYSDPIDQDSDDDGIGDFLEVDFFKTSPILADTDGDQMDDGQELFEASRNPLLADLPVPQIIVGNIRLDLDVRSSFTDEQGQTTEISSSSSTSFGQSRSDTFGTSSTTSTESENNFSQKIGFEAGFADGGFEGKVTGEAGFEQNRSQGFSSTVDRESAKESQQAWEQSVEQAMAQSQNRSVSRSVEGASIQAAVNLANRSNIAFSITNIELSVLQQDRVTGRDFQPIASLRASGENPTFNLGPLDGERGPIIFESTNVFPNLVDNLMREPTGLVFKVVNFDILDELGRNFAFTSQEVVERTAGIEIDFGDGVVEKYRVATASTFDNDGLPVGITLERGLEIAGIKKAAGGDPPLPVGPMTPAIRNSYGTLINSVSSVERLTRVRGVQNDRSTNPKKRLWIVLHSDPDTSPDVNFSEISLKAGDKVQLWFTSDVDDDKLFAREEYLYGSKDDDTDSDDDTLLDFFEVRTGWTVNRLPGLPYKVFPDPARVDSDLDGLTDSQEFAQGTDPHRSDTDEDGLSDTLEINGPIEIVLFDGDADETNDKLLNVLPYQDSSPRIVPGPNGVLDTVRAGDDAGGAGFGFIVPGPNSVIDSILAGDDYLLVIHTRMFATDPLNRDTDADGIPDGREAVLGTNPNAKDSGRVIDTDKDGLTDDEEDNGWNSVVNGVTVKVTSNKLRPDTDLDGLPDVYERAIGSNPRNRDSDNDTLSDLQEFDPADQDNYYNDAAMIDAVKRCNASGATACTVPTAPSTVLRTNINKADTDGDSVNDDLELTRKWFVKATGPDGSALPDVEVSSKPYRADDDGDGLNDTAEFTAKTNPSDGDSDDDGTDDGDETVTCDSGVCRDPLVADRLIKFEFTNFLTDDDCDAPGFEGAEMAKGFLYFIDPGNVQSSYQVPGTLSGGCIGEDNNTTADGTIGADVALTFTKTFFVKATQTFQVKNDANMIECDSGSDDPLQPTSVTFTYATVAASPPNVRSDPPPTSEFKILAAAGANPQGGCQFRVLMKITSLVTAKP